MAKARIFRVGQLVRMKVGGAIYLGEIVKINVRLSVVRVRIKKIFYKNFRMCDVEIVKW